MRLNRAIVGVIVWVFAVVFGLAGCVLETSQRASDTSSVSSAKASTTNGENMIETELPETLKIATFNASMDGSNYVARGIKPVGDELPTRLANGEALQIKNVAEIIQRVRPDILLINEFDYIADPEQGVLNFQRNYLSQSQQGQEPIHYPHYFVAPVNTGVPVNYDTAKGKRDPSVYGFGHYPGQYGMVVLSRFPIATEQVRTFQHFLWQDMPGNLLTDILDETGNAWYSERVKSLLRLSSKSHWDVPVKLGEKVIHVLASHPTPPVFDGPEDRNGKRNHDEIRFWRDYLNGDTYFYDDNGKRGGFSGETFVIVGDLNSSAVEGDAMKSAIANLINHPLVNDVVKPMSEGGKLSRPENPHAATHTAGWGMRADYVLPAKAGWSVKDSGVFWPAEHSTEYRLIESRGASSDHRLVWLEMKLETN